MNRPVLEGREDPGIGRIKVKEGKRHRDRGHDPTHHPLRIDLSEEPFVVDDGFFIFRFFIHIYGFLIFSHLAESPYLR